MPRHKNTKEHKKRREHFMSQPLEESEDEDKGPKRRVDIQPENLNREEEDGEETRVWHIDSEEMATTNALPVKSQSGKWKKAKYTIKITDQKSDNAIIKDEEVLDCEGEEDPGDQVVSSSLIVVAPSSKSYEEVRKDLATMAIDITEDTEKNISKLKDMFKYADPRVQTVEVTRLTLVTILAVIKDILPGYYIRPISDAEKTTNVSKEVKKSRDFETTILSSYRRFLEILKGIVQPKRQNIPKSHLPILVVALKCLHELMLFASHFNFFEDILKLVGHSLTLPFASEVERSCQAFRRLFDLDTEGHITMLAIRLISNMIKEREYKCPPIWLIALETVRIQSNVANRLATAPKGVLTPKRPKHLSGRQVKEWKAKQEELGKMAEAEDIVSREELKKWNRESLSYLFRVYFGILKNAPTAELLPPVLAGLARHSHRIGVEYFTDLLQSLKRLMMTGHATINLDVVSSLHCILTADRIYTINENLASMDLKFFYNSLFVQLGRLSQKPKEYEWESVGKPLQACMTNLFHPKRHIPVVRAAAFLQRLTDVAVSFTTAGLEEPAIFIVESIRNILSHHDRAQTVLDREPFGQGSYIPDCVDPDLCNPYSRSLYEIFVGLKCQSRGKLKSVIEDILKLSPKLY